MNILFFRATDGQVASALLWAACPPIEMLLSPALRFKFHVNQPDFSHRKIARIADLNTGRNDIANRGSGEEKTPDKDSIRLQAQILL